MDQNKETAAMLVVQNNPRGIEFYSYANNYFCLMAAGHESENNLLVFLLMIIIIIVEVEEQKPK